MDQWKRCIIEVFGKKAKRSWHLAALDLRIVDLGVKAACLFDHWLATAQEMSDLIKNASQHGLVINTLTVVTIGQDVVIFNPVSLQVYSNCCLPRTLFVDISPELPQPNLATENQVKVTTEAFIRFVNAASDKLTLYQIHPDNELNVPCLFGLFLGYPCVYWYKSVSFIKEFLLEQPLAVYQVHGTLSGQLGSEHNIFSFSLPLNLLPVLRPTVDKWFETWKNNQNWEAMFSRVWIQTETVNPESLCL